MSITSALNVAGGIGGAASAAGSLAGDISSWFTSLTPASYGGVAFGVESVRTEAGRKTAEHVYPFRDDVWIEDLGKRGRKFDVEGFLVEGDLITGTTDVVAARQKLLDACEKAGGQPLVHPTLGNIDNVCCLGVEIFERRDLGRVFEFRLSLAVTGPRKFPTATTSSGPLVSAAAQKTTLGAIVDFVKTAAADIQKGAAAVQAAVSTAMKWYQAAVTAVNDAKRLFGAVSTLAGNFGDLFGGANTGYAGANPTAPLTTTAQDLLATAAANRAAVATAAVALQVAVGNLSSSTVPGAAVQITAMNTNGVSAVGVAAQAFLAAIVNAANDPADAVRLVSVMAQFYPASITTPGAVSAACNVVQAALAAMFRRYALAQLAVTLTTYQPSSQDDAASVLAAATALFDAEITVAGDAGDDESYQALRAVRQAVVADLAARGANAAPIATFSFNAPLPVLVLANRIYRDASRETQLVLQVQPIHPAFMPPTFKALAS